MTEIETPQPPSEVVDGSAADSPRVVVDVDADQAIAFVDLLRPGDNVRLNRRRRPLEVTYTDDNSDRRHVQLRGNGTVYVLTLDRTTGEMTLDVGTSGTERFESGQVVNRNLFNIREYERLLREEIESTAPQTFHEMLRDIPHDTDMTTQQGFNEAESRVLRWALSAYLDQVARDYFAGNGEYQRTLWDDARTLWERFRHDRPITAYGHEMGKVGAVLDYAVEDPDIELPNHVEQQVDRLRFSKDVEPVKEAPPWPDTIPEKVQNNSN